jgi:glycerophosphoryl diester phosphodiesterase
MKFIAHRGVWNVKSEQNSYIGIKRALDMGFGVELDVRDKNGELMVSHDPTKSFDILAFGEILDLFKGYDSMLAINVKSDGILPNLESALTGFDHRNYFIFDMSVPEAINYLKSGLPTYMRLSEYEPYGELHERSSGIWLDAFHSDWWIRASEIFRSRKKICVVSPELHGRHELDAWHFLRSIDTTAELFICTDKPESAKVFFE